MTLPEDRMLLIGENLINVDDISTVSAKHHGAAPMLGIEESRWLEIITLSGTKIAVETDMTIREFEIERAKKFTPVVREETPVEKLAGADWGESDWKVTDVRTQWAYLHSATGKWTAAPDMGIAMDEAQHHDTLYRAVMHRTVVKEWDAFGD